VSSRSQWAEEKAQLAPLEKLFELPLNVAITIIINPRLGFRFPRFGTMVATLFPLLEALEEEGYKLRIMLEPVWCFEDRKEWVLDSEEQKEEYVWSPKDTEWNVEKIMGRLEEVC
jgi:hypothetical protein